MEKNIKFYEDYLALLKANQSNPDRVNVATQVINFLQASQQKKVSPYVTKPFTDDISKFVNDPSMSINDLMDSAGDKQVVKINQVKEMKQEENLDNIEIHSETLKKQKKSTVFAKAKKVVLAGACVLMLTSCTTSQKVATNPVSAGVGATTTTENKAETKKYKELDVKEGTNFNVNDLNSLTDAAANVVIEYSDGGYIKFKNPETGELIRISDEEALMLVEALNAGDDYDSWRKAEIMHDEATTQRYHELMNKVYVYTMASSMTGLTDEKSEIKYDKFIGDKQSSSMLMGLQADINEYHKATTPEAKQTKAKELLEKWVTYLEGHAEHTTNDAIMSIVQAQLYGFSARLDYDGYTFASIGFDISRFADVFYDLPSCGNLDEDAYEAYFHGAVRTENSDVTVTRMNRKIDFDKFFNKVKENKKAIKDGIESPKYNESVEWEELVTLVGTKAKEFNGGKEVKVTKLKDFTQERIEALENSVPEINLQDGESITMIDGQKVVLKDTIAIDPKIENGDIAKNEEEADKENKEAASELLNEFEKYYALGKSDAIKSGDRTGSGFIVPNTIPDNQNAYKNGYDYGVKLNIQAYLLGSQGSELTTDTIECVVAYNAGKAEYEKNKQNEDKKEEQEQVDFTKLETDFYNAGEMAFKSGASRVAPADCKMNINGMEVDFSYAWLNGYDNAKLIADNVKGPTDVEEQAPSNEVKDESNVETPKEEEKQESNTETPKEEEKQDSNTETPKEEPKPEETVQYGFDESSAKGAADAIAAGVRDNNAPCPPAPPGYDEFAYQQGWASINMEYEWAHSAEEVQTAEAEPVSKTAQLKQNYEEVKKEAEQLMASMDAQTAQVDEILTKTM